MAFAFGTAAVTPANPTWNPLFVLLSLFMACNGAFTAVQFIETLVRKKDSGASHTSKKGSALFSVFAAAWCIGVNCVWVMHFLAMSAVMFSTKPMRYNVMMTIVSLVYIFVGAFVALSMLTFHKHSIVYKIRNTLANGGVGAKLALMPSAVDGEDLHGSLDALRNELLGLAMDLLSFLSVRLAIGAVLMGTGVILMHYSGMMAMRCDDVSVVVSPVMSALSLPIAWIGCAVVLFFMFHMHGFKRRLAAALITGVAVNLIHYFGFFSGTFYIVPAVESSGTEFVVSAEAACVVVSLLSSFARFVFMGMIAATSD